LDKIKKNNEKFKNTNIEIKIYEILGIKKFKKCVFFLEKLIHFKDKGENINYHIENGKLENTDDFIKYLFYNGSIHVRNATFLSIAFLAKVIFFNNTSVMFHCLSIFIGMLITKDLYCVMLQRYNFIRIKKTLEKKKKYVDNKVEKDSQKIFNNLKEDSKILTISDNEKNDDIKLIEELQLYFKNISDAIITENDLDKLNRIKEIMLIYNDIRSNNICESTDIEKDDLNIEVDKETQNKEIQKLFYLNKKRRDINEWIR